jgi:ATP/maltotriose-dependent transcriptional regulator MalT
MLAGWILRVRGWRLAYEGRIGPCVQHMEGAVAQMRRANDLRSAGQTDMILGRHLIELGAFERAEEVLRRQVAQAVAAELHHLAATARGNLADVRFRLGAVEEATELARRCVAELVEYGDVRMEGLSRYQLAELLLARGELEAAEAEARLACEGLTRYRPYRAIAEARLAVVLLARAKVDEALEVARRGMTSLATWSAPCEESCVRLVFAEALHASGDVEGARHAIAEARDRLLDRAASVSSPDAREGFLTRVAANARTLDLARAWG